MDWIWSGGEVGAERIGAAQHRRWCRDVLWWIVAVFGAGDEDALDGAVVRIAHGQCSGAGRIEAGIAVGIAQPDDPLDGA